MKKKEVIITRAGTADAELIADLSRSTFYQAYAKANTVDDMERFMNEQFARERLIKEVVDGSGIFLLAYDGNEAVGYVRMRVNHQLNNGDAIEIARLYVAAHVIGKGVGSALMESCLQIAKDMQMKTVWLGVWEKNDRAITFYQKWGFEKFGEQIFQLGTDRQTDYLMKKML